MVREVYERPGSAGIGFQQIHRSFDKGIHHAVRREVAVHRTVSDIKSGRTAGKPRAEGRMRAHQMDEENPGLIAPRFLLQRRSDLRQQHIVIHVGVGVVPLKPDRVMTSDADLSNRIVKGAAAPLIRYPPSVEARSIRERDDVVFLAVAVGARRVVGKQARERNAGAMKLLKKVPSARFR